jgi:type VII secretion-associated serine protease mycosin
VRALSLPLVAGIALALAATAAPAASADLLRNREWPLAALHVPQAWKWSKGGGVTVAVLDTGVDGRHPDLIGRVIQGPDYTGHSRRPGSPYWGRHGTAMASIIAGHGHGPGRAAGVVGIAPHAKILSIRVTWENDDPERTNHARVDQTKDAVAKGIRYAVDHGAQIINMSLGGGKTIYNGNPAEADAVRYALGKGAMLIASAGNDGAGLNRRNYPAAYPGVTAVGAVDKTLRPARFTNRHDYVSVAAPGVDIVSADAGRSYVQGTGTSPSAAIVAGIAALVRSHCPMLTPEQTRQALEQGATRRPPGGRNTKIGAGVADAVRAIYAGHALCQARTAAQPARAETPTQPRPAAATSRADRPSLLLIGILACGGSLLVVSLVMTWRQRVRRRRGAGHPSYETAAAPYEITEASGPYGTAERYTADATADATPTTAATASRVPVGAAVFGAARWDEPPSWPVTTETAKTAKAPETAAALDDGRPAAAPAPRDHHHDRPTVPATAPTPATGFGDDPLGTGNVGSVEVSTPLADQSWETVLRDRRQSGGGRNVPEPPGGTA